MKWKLPSWFCSLEFFSNSCVIFSGYRAGARKLLLICDIRPSLMKSTGFGVTELQKNAGVWTGGQDLLTWSGKGVRAGGRLLFGDGVITCINLC